jgi:hypothetical protein
VTGFELCLTLVLLFMSVFTDFVAGTVNFVFVLNDVMRIDLFMLPSKEKVTPYSTTVCCPVKEVLFQGT